MKSSTVFISIIFGLVAGHLILWVTKSPALGLAVYLLNSSLVLLAVGISEAIKENRRP